MHYFDIIGKKKVISICSKKTHFKYLLNIFYVEGNILIWTKEQSNIALFNVYPSHFN